MYENCYFGMHIIGWFFLFILLFWVFFVPRDILLGQKNKKESGIRLLRKRLASGEISTDEFKQKRNTLNAPKNERDH